MITQRQEVADRARPDATIAIIGAGQAGGWAAQTLRKEGFAGKVVLIGDEMHPPHERPPLSKSVLAGEATPESTHLLKPEAFEKLSLDWRPGVRVSAIDRHAKQLRLADGSLSYDKLILCTGGRARTVAIAGSEFVGVTTLRTIGDALALAPHLKPGNTVIVVGGGWIGLEVAATARKKGAEAIVIEAQPRLCERTVPREISAHLLALHRAHGTRVILDAQIASLAAAAKGRSLVTLRYGQTFECDAIVIGIGLVANDELARGAGLECDGGVIVDAQCRTSDPDIFAAGDVAVAANRWAGKRIRLESWHNAQEQGIAAARSALGIEVDYQPLPWFWSDQYGMNLQIYGMPMPSYRTLVRGEPGSESFVLLYVDGDRVKAALGPNAARDLRFARRLIETQKPIALDRLSDPSVPLSKL